MTQASDWPGEPGVDETYYQVLDVSPGASRPEIVEAHQRARAAFAPDSLATYALFTPEEAAQMAERVETAFRVLVDGHKRSLYDEWLHARARGERPPPPDLTRGPAAEPPRERTTPSSPAAPAPPPAAPAALTPVPPPDSNERVKAIVECAGQCDGSLLARVRRARGISLEQINLSTKISLSNLRFIEDDTFDSLPAPVFLRNYLRQIAQCLDIDGDWVVDGYMGHLEQWTKRARSRS